MGSQADEQGRDQGGLVRWWDGVARHPMTHILTGLGVLSLDLVTGPYLWFPILFIIPVALSAWYCGLRLGVTLAVVLPLGRLLISVYVDTPGPMHFSFLNALIRVGVLLLFAYLVARTARQTRELRRRVDGFVTMCAWSRTIEYQGRWVSVEEYLKLRFNLDVTHGISPEEVGKSFAGFDFDQFAGGGSLPPEGGKDGAEG